MLKRSLLTLFAFVLLVAAFVLALPFLPLERSFPMPYAMEKTAPTIKGAIGSKTVLFLGDPFANVLFENEVRLARIMEVDLKPSSYVNALTSHSGPHRWFRLLKGLEKNNQMPGIVVVTLGPHSWSEQLVAIRELPTVLENIKRLRDPVWESWRIIFPELSHFSFQWPELIQLNENPTPATFRVSDSTYQQYVIASLAIFEKNLKDLTLWGHKRGIDFIFVEAPFDLLSPVQRVCRNAVAQSEGVDALVKAYEAKDMKKAFGRAELLFQHSASHAQVSFIFGKSALSREKFGKAYEQLLLAKAYDCQRPLANQPAFLHSAQRIAKRYEVPYFNTKKWLFERAIIPTVTGAKGHKPFNPDGSLRAEWKQKWVLQVARIVKKVQRN